ncbi:MAG: MOFRL family protein, partial [Vulcanimicrobiota bacterium]
EGRRGVLVASGEPTVAIRVENPGRGGRCQELALRFAREIAGCPGLRLLAGSSDGTDGPTEDAGALVDGTTWPELCRVLGEDEMERVLREHDSGSALSRLKGALLHTGPTGHNINDLYLLEIS